MKYMGSKSRHAKDILPIILANRKPGQLYVEPFVGGANVVEHVPGNRVCADIDPDLINLWQAVATGWEPPKTFTEEDYLSLRKHSHRNPLRGYAAFALSYAGKKWGGWCRDSAGKRDYVDEAYRNAKKQFPKLRGIEFVCCPYWDLYIPDGSIVYCDPPYAGTTKYGSDFDHDAFWDWVRALSKRCEVFVSEYTAPKDFISLWSKEVSNSLTQNTGSKKGVENLFKARTFLE